jgi:hypothetical protein
MACAIWRSHIAEFVRMNRFDLASRGMPLPPSAAMMQNATHERLAMALTCGQAIGLHSIGGSTKFCVKSERNPAQRG